MSYASNHYTREPLKRLFTLHRKNLSSLVGNLPEHPVTSVFLEELETISTEVKIKQREDAVGALLATLVVEKNPQ